MYSAARSGRLSLAGFPDITPVLNALKNGPSEQNRSDYKVCAPMADKLLILQSLAQKFVEEPSTKERTEEAIQKHNEEYNKDGVYLLSDRTLGFKLNEESI